MRRNKTGSVLVIVQIALTLAIVVNCMFLAATKIGFIGRPSGLDVDNMIVATSLGFGANYSHDETIDNDLRMLRELPGVIAATSASSIPMSGSGSASRFKANSDEDAPAESANYYSFDEQAVEALGVNIIEGRAFTDVEVMRSDDEQIDRMPSRAIVTKAFADQLYPDVSSAVGQRLYNNLNESAEIVGVVEHMHGAWVSWDNLGNVVWFPRRSDATSTRYIVRVEPGTRDALIPTIEETLSGANRNRLIRRVSSMSDVVGRSYQNDRAVAVVLFTAVTLLLIITGLGIVGLASFTVRQRTKQIGTRRAVGARKRDIIRYFLTENWLMTTLGIILGTALTIALNYALASTFDTERLNYLYLIIGVCMLWVLGFVSVAGPSFKASKVSPAVATRTV